MNRKLNFIQAAKTDLQDIWHYTFDKWGEEQASKYLATIESVCYKLVKSPLIGKMMPALGENIRVYHCQSHYIFYLEKQDDIIFIAFIHEKRDILRHVITRL